MDRIAKIVSNSGAITMADFMALKTSCNTGYYQNNTTITNDFITLPELTQIFGYVIGAELSSVYNKHFCGEKINLMELGPGSGKLMGDILGFIKKNNESMLQNTSVYMLENSESLSHTQKKNLIDYTNIVWVKSPPPLQGSPIFVVANEFLDALPVYQFTMTKRGIKEIVITKRGDVLHLIASEPQSLQALQMCPKHIPIGGVIEVSMSSMAIMKSIASDIKQSRGYGLFFDYGYIKSRFTNTIRGIKKHQAVDYLNTPGADISADVDFGTLAKIAKTYIETVKLKTQSKTLYDLGFFEVVDRVADKQQAEFIYKQIRSMTTFKTLSLLQT